jgi:beta-phosphoglucomutase
MQQIHIVFDLDGTLADTQKIHQQIESEFLASYGLSIDPSDIGRQYAGRSPIEWIPECLHQQEIEFSPQSILDFVHSKDTQVVSLLAQWSIELLPSVRETLISLSQHEWVHMGISSGACREFIDDFLEYFDLDMIDATTSADEVIHKKPAPDVFLSSFQQLEDIYGTPDVRWVIWDGKTDVIWGSAAWAQTILCFHSYDVPYTYRVDDFSEITHIILS